MVDLAGLIGGSVLAYFVVGYVADRFKSTSGGPSMLPEKPLGPPPGRGMLPKTKSVTVEPGRTYFVTLQTHGGANFAGVDDAKKEAVARGFTDVVAFKTGQQPAPWPISHTVGDFAVRGTFSGAAPKTMLTHEGNFLGSVDVLEVFEA
jgi:hypothetical protein